MQVVGQADRNIFLAVLPVIPEGQVGCAAPVLTNRVDPLNSEAAFVPGLLSRQDALVRTLARQASGFPAEFPDGQRAVAVCRPQVGIGFEIIQQAGIIPFII
jgi:hypothetical protein